MIAEDSRIEQALHDAIATLGADSGTVHLKDPDTFVLHLAAWHGPIPETVLSVIKEIPWGEGMAGIAAERAEPVGTVSGQTMSSPEVHAGALVVPMLLGDEVVGTIGVGCKAEREFTVAETKPLLLAGRALARRLAPEPLDVLRALVARHADARGLEWLETGIAAARRGDQDAVVQAFPAAARRLGRGPLGSRSALVLQGLDVEVPLRAWRIDDAGRVAILLAFAGDKEALARDLYFGGDLRERAGALRALAVVGRGAVALDAVLDACRVNAVELFEAALAENPYTSRVLPDQEFRKAVLKCTFVGVPLDRIAALDQRADEELSRMLLSYVTEREVAGRSVPPDIWPVVALSPIPGLVAKLLGYLEHPAESHRAAAALALARIGDQRARPFLEDRLAREADEAVRRALLWALA